MPDNLSDYYKFNRRGIRLVRLEDSYQLTTARNMLSTFVRPLRYVNNPPYPKPHWKFSL